MASLPLGQDWIGSGIFTALDPTGGTTAKPRFKFKDLDTLLPVHQALKRVSDMVTVRLRNADKSSSKTSPPEEKTLSVTPPQVAIKYVCSKGFVPLLDVVTLKQAEVLEGLNTWNLSRQEIHILEKAADEIDRLGISDV